MLYWLEWLSWSPVRADLTLASLVTVFTVGVRLFEGCEVLGLVIIYLTYVSTGGTSSLLSGGVDQSFSGNVVSAISKSRGGVVGAKCSSFSVPRARYEVPHRDGFSVSLEAFNRTRQGGSAGSSEGKFALVGSNGSVGRCSASLFRASVLGFPSNVDRDARRLVDLKGLVV